MGRSFAEQEVTFRWDMEERVLWAGTTTPWVAAKWERNGQPVRILSHDRDGEPCSWEVKLPWLGSKRHWLRCFPQAVFSSPPLAGDAPATGDQPEDEHDDGDEP